MGFSLVMFFQDLVDILDDPFLSMETKLELIEKCTNDAALYARECGQI